jgi:hypothetical protein
MASNSGRSPAKTVNKGGSSQPKSGGDAPKIGGSGGTKPVGSPTPAVRKTGATNNGGPSRGARGGQK